MTIKLVVFDIAGTTLKDDEDLVAQSFTAALEAQQIELNGEDLSKFMGYRKIDAIRMILDEKNIEAADDQVQEMHDHFIELINLHYDSNPIEEIDGATEVFEALHREGIKIAINTGFSRSTTDIILRKLGWLENALIDHSVCSDEVEEGRPYPHMIRKIMADLDIEDVNEVAKVGDTPSDLMEGKNAGCGLTIGVLYGTHSKSDLEQYPHDHLISDIRDLTDILISA